MPEVKQRRPDDPTWIGDYRIEGRLGDARQTPVYRATGPYGEAVAIRRLREHRAGPAVIEQIAAARLVTPLCTAQILDVQLNDPFGYVVSEYIDGPSLLEQIERNGPMNGIELQRLAIGTSIALATIHHAGVVHSRLNPANVVLAEDGARLVDFAVSQEAVTEDDSSGRGSGTPARSTSGRSQGGPGGDLFAWASIIVFAATGRTSRSVESLRSMAATIVAARNGVAASLVDSLRRVLSPDPALRPSAQQALALLFDREAVAVDLSDPTPVLAEAAWLVRASHLAPTPELYALGLS